MITGQLGIILEELSRALHIPNLHPDDHESCLLRLHNGLEIQIELDKMQNSLIIGINLGEIPLGRYREDLFESALKINGESNKVGILAYSTQRDNLVLFEMLPLKDLTGTHVADLITPLSEKALNWKQAISSNQIPQSQNSSFSTRRGIFGLTP